MNKFIAQWKAGFVRRWHSNPDLSYTADPTDGHSARVVKIALILKPDLSRAAIIYGLRHDDGECGLGDVSGLWKRNNPDLAKEPSNAERDNLYGMGIVLPEVSEEELQVIDLSDKIDAYLWMLHHRPELAETNDWSAAREWIKASIVGDRAALELWRVVSAGSTV